MKIEANKATTGSETVKQTTTEVPSVFPFDPGESSEKEVVADETPKTKDNDGKMIELKLLP